MEKDEKSGGVIMARDILSKEFGLLWGQLSRSLLCGWSNGSVALRQLNPVHKRGHRVF